MGTDLVLTRDMAIVLGLVVFTMTMFMFERIRSDVTALVVLILLGIFKLIKPDELILGAGLDHTGALNRLAGWLLRRSKGVEDRLILWTSAVAGLMSGFMQNPSV